MKYFSVLLCLFLCYELSTQEPRLPFHGRKRSNGFYAVCLELLGLSREDLTAFEHSGEAHDKLLNGEGDYKNVGCFLACLHQKHGVMKGNTFVRDDVPPYHMQGSEENNPEKAERRKTLMETWNTCMDTAEEAGGDECDVALAFHVCFEKVRRKSLPPLE